MKSPATVRNYAGALASSYRQMGLESNVFQAYRVKLALTSIDKNVRHVPQPSLPVSANILKRIIRVPLRLREGQTVATAFILMFHTFFRQSNFAATTSLEFDHTQQLTRGDITIEDQRVVVKHKWSKTHQAASHHAQVSIPAVQGSLLCPRNALVRMIKLVPTRHSCQPLLSFRDGSHMPLSYIRRVWNIVLEVIGLPNHASYSLHGLRRGAATHVIGQDPSAREAIKEHGMWRSDAVDCYLPAKQNKVFTLMRHSL